MEENKIIEEILNAEKQHRQKLDQDISEFLKEGPYVYELYAVIVHSGGALGGHYYAYINSFENGNWYNFNDSSVSRVRYNCIENVYGEHYPKCISSVFVAF